MSFQRISFYWFPVILWVCFIYLLSTGYFSSVRTSSIIEPLLRWFFSGLTAADIKLVHTVIRKCMHVFVYFVLALLLFRAYRGGSQELKLAKWIAASLFTLILLAAADEYHQSFISTRTPSIGDVGFDTLGGVMAMGVIMLWTRYQKSV